MAKNTPFVVQWGILGCGWISSKFAEDLCLSPSARGADVSHAVVAVGSRSVNKAADFIKQFCPNGGTAQVEGLCKVAPKAYGSYAEVVSDPNVHIVYIGTLNMCHYDDARLVLEAGKHCLVEKPATLNAAEWADLCALAKRKGLFLMEGMWTRFNPCMCALEKAIHDEGVIGDLRALYSDYSMDALDRVPDSHRAMAAEVGGGTLIDTGPYPLVYSMMLLFRHPKNERTPPQIGSTMMLARTGVDLATSVTLMFPRLPAVAYLTMNGLSQTSKTAHTRIVGTKGEITVHGFTSRPSRYTLRRLVDAEKGATFSGFHAEETFDHGFDGFGLFWEADAVARCLRDGLLECPRMPHAETLMTMQLFDKVRKDGGYEFLPGLEKVTAKM